MTSRAKNILRNSIHKFESVNQEQKKECIETIKSNISIHENSLKAIGMGLDDDMMVAGKVLLRIIRSRDHEEILI